MSNNKYLICLDLDGTTLTDNKKIRLRTKLYLKKLINKGHIVTFSSGRPFRSLKKYYDMMGLNCPVICFNGSYIINPHDENFKPIIHTIDVNDVKDFYKTFKTNFIDAAFAETLTSIFVDKKDSFLFTFNEVEDTKVEMGKVNEIIDKDPLAFVMHLNEKSEEIEKEMKDFTLQFKKTEVRFWSNSKYCECHIKNISKASAIKELGLHYNIPLDHIITFGDEDNDFEMLNEFENSFLMCNGNMLLKNVAKNITKKDNNHNGIVFALKEFFKSKGGLH